MKPAAKAQQRPIIQTRPWLYDDISRDKPTYKHTLKLQKQPFMTATKIKGSQSGAKIAFLILELLSTPDSLSSHLALPPSPPHLLPFIFLSPLTPQRPNGQVASTADATAEKLTNVTITESLYSSVPRLSAQDQSGEA